MLSQQGLRGLERALTAGREGEYLAAAIRGQRFAHQQAIDGET